MGKPVRDPLVVALVLTAPLFGGCGGSHADAGARRATPTSTPAIPSFDTSRNAAAPERARPLPAGVLGAVRVPGAPAGVAASRNAVWVSSHRGQTLYRINPRTRRIAARVNVGQNACGPLQVAFGWVWISSCGDTQRTVVVDAATNRIVGRAPNSAVSVAVDNGGVWVADPPRAGRPAISRLDPQTLSPVRRLAVETAPSGLAYGADSLWLNFDDRRAIARVDPRSGRTLATIRVPTDGKAIRSVFTGGALWAGTDDGVWRLSPGTDRPRRIRIPRFRTMWDVGTGGGRLWLRQQGGRVAAIDLDRGRVAVTYPADAGSGGPRGGGFRLTVGREFRR